MIGVLERRADRLETAARGIPSRSGHTAPLSFDTFILEADLYRGRTSVDAKRATFDGSRWQTFGNTMQISGEEFCGYGFTGRLVVATRLPRVDPDELALYHALWGGVYFVYGTVTGVTTPTLDDIDTHRVTVSVIDEEPIRNSLTVNVAHSLEAVAPFRGAEHLEIGATVGLGWHDYAAQWVLILEPC